MSVIGKRFAWRDGKFIEISNKIHLQKYCFMPDHSKVGVGTAVFDIPSGKTFTSKREKRDYYSKMGFQEH